MIPALRSEFRKLFTVRSTYVILFICLVLEFIFAFYVTAFHATAGDAHNPTTLASEVTDAMSALSTLIALVGVLLVTHEYRYNTIVYTLSAARSRTAVLVAKVVAVSCLVIVVAALFSALAPVLAIWGFHIRGLALVHQQFPLGHLLLRAVFAGWAFSMLALILALIIRIQVGAIAAVFLIPGTVEQLLGLILKKNQVYLPFSSINAVLDKQPAITHSHAALIALCYLVGGWLIAWALFKYRDAN